MGTWFEYVCLTHEPRLGSGNSVHGHGNAKTSTTVALMRLAWENVTGQGGVMPPSLRGHEAWLLDHQSCRVGVVDGYGGMVELGGPPEPLADANLKFLGAVEPGKRYLLRATDHLSVEAADQLKRRLRETFPDSEFGVLSPNLETVAPMGLPVPSWDYLAGVLREVADEQPGYTELRHVLTLLARRLTQTGDGAATPPAEAPTSTPASNGGEQADESATGAATPGHAPSPSYSEETIVRAYALGIANSHGRVTPSQNDWAMAWSWWES